MNQRSLFCAGIWPFLVFPVAILLPLLLVQYHSIEEHIASNAQTEITEQFHWARVENFNRGRDPLIVGTAPDQEQISAVLAQGAKADGVRSMSFAGVLGEPKAPKLVFAKDGNNISISGFLANQSEIDKVVSDVQRLFPSSQLDNQISVGSNIAEEPRIKDLLEISVATPAQFSFTVENAELNYRTVVQSDNAKKQLAYKFGSVFDQISATDVKIVAPRCQIAVNKILSSTKINFSIGNATISPSSEQTLQSLVQEISSCPDAEFEIQGHTDSSGTPEVNIQLSQRRAEAVLNRLVDLGLDRGKFEVVGYGARNPIADNDSREGRAQNRRIQFRVTN